MLYDVTTDTGTFVLLDLDGDGQPETKVLDTKVITVEAASGDEAAALAIAQGAKFVRGVNVSSRVPESVQAAPAPEATQVADAPKRGPGRPRKAD